MIVVADSSPLIILAKLGCFDFLQRLYSRVYISPEVYGEVVYSGAGLLGASEVSKSAWIEVKALQNQAALTAAHRKSSLGLGELATVFLAKEIGADELLLDDQSARAFAKAEGFQVRGSIGLVEAFFRLKRFQCCCILLKSAPLQKRELRAWPAAARCASRFFFNPGFRAKSALHPGLPLWSRLRRFRLSPCEQLSKL